MRKLLLFITLVLSGLKAYSEVNPPLKKSVTAIEISSPMRIDGVLDEAVYTNTTPATEFYQLQPNNGSAARAKSEVYFFYDDDAVYIGAMLYDNPDSIYNFLSQRDNIGRSDYFGVYLDPYNEALVSYGFFITPAGVQTDIKAIKSDYDGEDGSWDAVWQSKTRIVDDGWIVEYKIPYSALRIPQKDVHTWGLNMFRNIRRYDSNNSWNWVNNEINGFMHQQGELTGIKNVKPPFRLSLSPYSAVYYENNTGSGGDFLYKAGLDLKMGLNESFTLDMMLIPDFGQVQSDDAELNLSPYELYYDENRQFFTEGTELFDRANIFYSRRIGQQPINDAEDKLATNEVIRSMPSETKMINATKISGRTKNGVGIGFLNAITQGAYAEVEDTVTGKRRDVLTQPFTNYNVTVIEKSLPNNSFVSFINTNRSFYGDTRMANVTGMQGQLKTKDDLFTFRGSGSYSYNKLEEINQGSRYDLSFQKTKGAFNFGIENDMVSSTYDNNAMGFIRRNNELNSEFWMAYNWNEPKSFYRRFSISTWAEHARTLNPSVRHSEEYGTHINMQLKSYHYLNFIVDYNTAKKDFYETRVDGRYIMEAADYRSEINFRTDMRKPLSVRAEIGGKNFVGISRYTYWWDLSSDVRVGRHLTMDLSFQSNSYFNDFGYVEHFNADSVIFGRRDRRSNELELESQYTFNNTMSLGIRARHYWSGAVYEKYSLLNADGSLNDQVYEGEDVNFNTLSVDLIFRWVFAPGSELSVAWKNNSFDSRSQVQNAYLSNLDYTIKASQRNSISVKALYYIDYNKIRKTMID